MSVTMRSTNIDLAVVGGGAAGYFAALRAAELAPTARITIFEGGRRPLDKVRISGGGRCNVTHHCFDTAKLVTHYPRGGKELRSAFSRFQPRDTIAWFEERGVPLKTERDGRVFPVSDSSESIIACLEEERRKLGITLCLNTRVVDLKRREGGGFEFGLKGDAASVSDGEARCLMLATGGNRNGFSLAQGVGHEVTAPVPSLFTFTITDPGLLMLAGVSVEEAMVTLRVRDRAVASHAGALLVTHWGMSGPTILRLSAWGARELHASGYQGELLIDWTRQETQEHVRKALLLAKQGNLRKRLSSTPMFDLPARLWEFLLERTLGEDANRTWGEVSKAQVAQCVEMLTSSRFEVVGKGQFKEEFVTCGGVRRDEVDFRSMESRCCPGLFLGGELLDIDGLTGGFNFQNAWTTGWLAGSSLAARLSL